MKTPELANRLELSYALDSNDGLLKPIPASMDKYTTPETPANAGGTAVPIQSRLSTLLTDAGTGLATTQQPGISPSNKDNKNGATPKLLFWNGMVGGKPAGHQRPGQPEFAVDGRRTTWSIPGTGSLKPSRGDTFSVTKLVYLSPVDLALFSFRRKVHIKGVNYLVGSMKAALGDERQGIPTEVQLWRV